MPFFIYLQGVHPLEMYTKYEICVLVDCIVCTFFIIMIKTLSHFAQFIFESCQQRKRRPVFSSA